MRTRRYVLSSLLLTLVLSVAVPITAHKTENTHVLVTFTENTYQIDILNDPDWLWLMLSPLYLTWDSPVAAAVHICGALALTVSVTSLASVVRMARFLNVIIGVVLIFAPLVTGGSVLAYLTCFAAGLLLIGAAMQMDLLPLLFPLAAGFALGALGAGGEEARQILS